MRLVSDALIDELIAAPSRDELITRVRALDRVLQWGFYVVPHWHISCYRIAYWNKFGRPEIVPQYGLGLLTWWSSEL